MSWPRPFKFYHDLASAMSDLSSTRWIAVIASHSIAIGFLYYVVRRYDALDWEVVSAFCVPLAGMAGFNYAMKAKQETAMAEQTAAPETTTTKTDTHTISVTNEPTS